MISKCIIDIALFTVQANIIHNVPEFQLTIKTYLNLTQFRFIRNQSYYRMKLRMFHFIMMAKFLSHTAKTCIWKWFIILLYWPMIMIFGILHPFLTFTKGILYWISIVLSCTSLLFVELTTLFVYKPPTCSRKPHNDNTPMVLIDPERFTHPLPKYYCVFSGVALLPSFTGWLTKLGKTFGGFISSMHQIGINCIYLFQLQSVSSQSILKVKKKRIQEQWNINFSMLTKLLLIFMIYPKQIFHSVNATYHTAKKSQGNDYFHHDEWEISNDTLNKISWEPEEYNKMVNTVTDIEKALCFTSIAD